MALFEDKGRTRTAPRKQGEALYAFYDSTGRPAYDVYRALLNQWLSEMPEAEQAEMVTRFRDGARGQFEAALAELVVHAALTRLGHSIEIHPDCPHPTRHPDFLVRDASGQKLAYVEVTTFGPEVEIVARDNREAVIYNGLEAVDLPPGWLLSYSLQQHGETSPSIKKLKRDVEVWAKEVCGDDPSAMPTKVFEANDWQIELTLIGGFNKEKNYERKIGAAMQGVRTLSPHLDLRQALELKGRRYGNFDAPYLIVVADCKESIPTSDDIADTLIGAVYGGEAVTIKTYADGTREETLGRTEDGYWGVIGAHRNDNVSGVALLPRSDLWRLRNEKWQPLLIINPDATHQLPEQLLPLPRYVYQPTSDEFTKIDGTLLADMVELPAEWPPAD